MFKTQMQTKSQESINLDIQISETFCSSLASLFPTSSIFWSILFPPIYYPTLSPQQKEQKTIPVTVLSNHLATFFFLYFNVLHVLSWSLLFIHLFILFNPPPSSILLTFLSLCLSHSIHLLLHFPLPSIIIRSWLFLRIIVFITNWWDWYIWMLLLLKTTKLFCFLPDFSSSL